MTKVIFSDFLPDPKDLLCSNSVVETSTIYTNLISRKLVIVYDGVLKNENFNKWLKLFEYTIEVQSGENLKSLESFSKFIKKIDSIKESIALVAVGGGSVGDFVGFVASVYHRGVPLIHIPSTWLAVIDSSHGGKTGLNFAEKKNQIGSFYPSIKTFVCKNLLMSLDQTLTKDTLSELLKIALISGGELLEALQKKPEISFDLLYSLAPLAIEEKMKIVNSDYQEKLGIRSILNLGHSLGHVFEVKMGWSHARAVAQGLRFSLDWSHHKKILSDSSYKKILDLFNFYFEEKQNISSGLSYEEARDILFSDKKRTSKNKIKFIFIKDLGEVEVQEVEIESVLEEFRRQYLVA